MKKFYFCAIDTKAIGYAPNRYRLGTVEAQSEALAEICVEQFFLQGRTKETLKATGLFVPWEVYVFPAEHCLHLNISLCINLQKD